ncbi:MAG: MT-A70 family methyltransferase [Alphaproteobacteria bacterium]
MVNLDDIGRRYGAIYADPPWSFTTYSDKGDGRSASNHYATMSIDGIKALPVEAIAAPNCVLFMWICWPSMPEALAVIEAWGFTYKTCGFSWFKGHSLPLFPDDMRDQMGCGYWTRSNSEVCLLATKGKPKREKADVRQAILEPRREHSRKPDCVHDRIERLVAGPYIELFARRHRDGWDSWGDECIKIDAYDPTKDARDSYDVAIRALGEKHRAGG